MGLGYVGLPLGTELGKHRPVLGFDKNTARIAELQSGQDCTLKVSAKNLQEVLSIGFKEICLEICNRKMADMMRESQA